MPQKSGPRSIANPDGKGKQPEAASDRSFVTHRRAHGIALALLFLLAVASLGGALFSSETVISDRSTDTASQFLYSRAFGFEELAKGNLALWNPYNYGGAPFLGDFQSALLYLPNILFLILPLATAINWSFVFHVFLLGAGMYAWAFHRGLRPMSAFVAGVAAMFSGTFFLHIYAGHLTNISGMPWVPLVFLGIDGWLARRHAGWIFLASGAVAMQIFAGHPQYVYYTALIAGLYSLTQLPGRADWLKAVPGLIAIYPLAALFAAVQLLPGLAAGSESVRSGGVGYQFAAMFSFPPENALTLLAPGFFGDMLKSPYWGRCYLWEMSLFAGAGMVLLAIHGATRRGSRDISWRLLVVLGVAVILGLGMHTPVHQMLYNWLPGFNLFRSSSKFMYFAALFLGLFAGMGMERLLAGEKAAKPLFLSAIGAGVLVLMAAFILSQPSGVEAFKKFTQGVVETRESYLHPAFFQDQKHVLEAQSFGVGALRGAGFFLVGFGVLFWMARRWTAATWVIAAAAVLEIFSFARGSVSTFPMKDFTYQPVADFLKQNPGDYRTLNIFNPDAAMLLRSENVWGYDPSVLKRYARLLHATQGYDPEQASQYLQFQRPHPILTFLRCRFAMMPKADGGIEIINLSEKVFPRFYLAVDYEVREKEAILEALKDPTVDLSQKVFLEKEPIPRPSGKPGKYEMRVLEQSTDHTVLEIRTEEAVLLVNPDTYSKDWQAVALPGSVQTAYEILPANYAVRCIPLAAGRHLLRMEYSPAGFTLGAWLSLLSLGAVVAVLSVPAARQRLSFSPQG